MSSIELLGLGKKDCAENGNLAGATKTADEPGNGATERDEPHNRWHSLCQSAVVICEKLRGLAEIKQRSYYSTLVSPPW